MGSPATFDTMSPRPSKSSRSKRSKTDSVPRPRNRRVQADDAIAEEKVLSKSKGAKSRAKTSGKRSASDRKEQRKLEREARIAERQANRQERKARWEERMAWSKDPRVKQVTGILALGGGAFMLLAGLSAILTGGDDIRFILSEAQPGAGSYRNLLGALGAKWAFAFMRGGFGIAAPFYGAWLVMAGWAQLAPDRAWDLGRGFRNVLAASILLPWSAGLLTLSFDVETGLVTGWGGDHLVGAVGLWLTQWSRFTLGVLGSILTIVSGYAIWAIFHPGISGQIKDFFARDFTEEVDVECEEDEALGEEALPSSNRRKSAREMADEEESDVNALEPKEGKRETEDPAHRHAAADAPFDLDGAVPVGTSSVGTKAELEEVQPVQEAETEKPVATPAQAEESSPEPDESTPLEVEVAQEENALTEDEIDTRVQAFGEYDPTLELSRYELPNIDLLATHGSGKTEVSHEELEENKKRIEDTLSNYGIEIASIKASIGPTVTLYELVPAPGVRISKIKNLEDDIALSLAALGIRIIAPIPGRGTIGIEVPNSNPDVVSMRSLIASDKFQNSDAALPIAIGKTISNETYVFDLAKMPHMLMAGATGQGKSVGLNAMLVSLLYKKHPSQLKFVLVDPKKVELTLFNHIERHYLAKLPDSEEAIITDNTQVVRTIKSLCLEMDQRYELLKNAQCRNLKEYNAKFVRRKLNPEEGHRYLPYIVLVIDEFADLIMTAGKEVEMPIARLAQLARAIGIHLIIATQRPSVNIITGTIKANFPGRVAFRVTSKVDSRTILDAGGADQLIGRGDMLLSTGNDLIRLQCGFVDTPEVEAITDFIGSQRGYPDALILPEVPDEHSEQMGDIAAEERDSMFHEAARILVLHQQGSTSLLQRKLKLGYNRAGRLVDQLEAAGVIGPFEGSKARKVLVPDEASLEQLLRGSSSDDMPST